MELNIWDANVVLSIKIMIKKELKTNNFNEVNISMCLLARPVTKHYRFREKHPS